MTADIADSSRAGLSGRDIGGNAITTIMSIGGGESVNAVMSRPLGDFNLIVFGSENDDVLTGQGRAESISEACMEAA